MTNHTFSALVYGLRYVAANIMSVELQPKEPGELLPAYEAGAHIDLHLPNGLVRSYSLTNPLESPDRYVVAVLNDRNSRGGSRFIHEQLRVGTEIKISAPRNLFQLNEAAPHSFLLAGGIGITPLYAMLQKLAQLGKSADVLVCARTRKEAAFLKEMQALQGEHRRVQVHIDEEAGGPPDLQRILSAQSADTHFYCCGPLPMIQAFEQSCSALGYPHVHVEKFAAEPPKPVAASEAHSYIVELRQSGKELQVCSSKPLLDALLAAGVDAPYSCQEGICGACETPVLEGEVDHRDSILSTAEREANRCMMLCVSHAKTPKLVLDL